MSGSGFILSYRPGTTVGGAVADVWEAASNPGVTNDEVDSAGIGMTFNAGDMWYNTATGLLWICVDASTGAAVWRINVVSSTGAPTDTALARFDGVTGQLIKGSVLTLSDAGELLFPAAGSVNINSGAAVLNATSLTLASAMAIGVTSVESKGIVLRNSTAAAVGAQQYSPSIYMAGQGWDTTPGVSREFIWRQTLIPVQGTTINGNLTWSFSRGGGAYTDVAQIDQYGVWTLPRYSYVGCGPVDVSSGNIGLYHDNAMGLTDVHALAAFGTAYSLQLVSGRASGAGNISVTADAFVNAAAIDPAHKVLALSWIDNVYARHELGYFTGGGGLTLSSAMAIGVTPVESKSLVLRNSTAAADGAQQYSPSIYLAGQGWETTTSTSDEVVWRITNVPVQGTAAGTRFVFASSLNGAAYVDKVYLDSGANLLWATDGTGSIGALAANRPNAVYAKTFIYATGAATAQVLALGVTDGYVTAGKSAAQSTVIGGPTTVFGLGTTPYVMASANTTAPFVVGHPSATDAASGIVIASVYDRNAASITNAATMRLHSFGWTNNADTYTELASVRADGAIYALSFNSTAATTAIITGAEADGATAIGVKLNTSTAYSTAGSKLLSVQNNGTEKAYLTFDGLLRVASSIRVAGDYGSGEASCVTFTDVVDAAGDTAVAAMGNWRVNGSAGVFHGWLKYWDGVTYVSIPCYHAA